MYSILHSEPEKTTMALGNKCVIEDFAGKCEIITPNDSRSWHQAVKSADTDFKFLCSDWTELLAETYGYHPLMVIARSGDEIKAILPLVVVRSMFTGTRGISLPFLDVCRPLFSDESQLPKLYQTLLDYGRANRWDYIELRGELGKTTRSLPSLGFYNHVVNLSAGPSEIFRQMASSNQRAVRKAEKEGMQILFSTTTDSLDDFYRLQCLTRKRHGLPSQPYRFFKNLHRKFIESGRGTIVSAHTPSGGLAASAIYLEQGSTIHYKYGASDRQYQQSRCNNLVMWSAIKHYSEKGFKRMDLGRNSIDNIGLRRYKQSWGGTESTIHYHRYDLKKNAVVEMTDDVFGWYNAIFKRLPNPLLQLAGRLLYPHIA